MTSALVERVMSEIPYDGYSYKERATDYARAVGMAVCAAQASALAAKEAEILRLGTDWADAEARLSVIRKALEPLREMEKRATPGQWQVRPSDQGGMILMRGSDEQHRQHRHPQTHLQIVPAEDAELIAALRNLLPALLDAAGEE